MQLDLDTLRGFFQAAPFMADLGAEPTSVEPGRVRARVDIAKRHCQHTGVVHAGVIATLAADGHWVLTAEFKTSLLRGASGERLECEAWVVKPGRQVSFTEAEVYAVAGGERRLVAKAIGTMAITKAE
jgi:uncharacterized protein (TIGR00369 family)